MMGDVEAVMMRHHLGMSLARRLGGGIQMRIRRRGRVTGDWVIKGYDLGHNPCQERHSGNLCYSVVGIGRGNGDEKENDATGGKGKKGLNGDWLDWKVHVRGQTLAHTRWGLWKRTPIQRGLIGKCTRLWIATNDIPLYRSKRDLAYHPNFSVFQRVAVDASNSKGLSQQEVSSVVFGKYQMQTAVAH